MGCYAPKEKRASSDFVILSNSAGTGKNNALWHLLDQLREFKVNFSPTALVTPGKTKNYKAPTS